MTASAIAFRMARRGDLPALLALLPDLSADPAEVRALLPDLAGAEAIFDRMQGHGNVHIVVGERPGGAPVATCMIAIVPNLTYGKPWAIIENVVVAAAEQGGGIGRALLAWTFAFAREQGCYKAQLLSGPKPRQVNFYRQVGMDDGQCHGFKIRFDGR